MSSCDFLSNYCLEMLYNLCIDKNKKWSVSLLEHRNAIVINSFAFLNHDILLEYRKNQLYHSPKTIRYENDFCICKRCSNSCMRNQVRNLINVLVFLWMQMCISIPPLYMFLFILFLHYIMINNMNNKSNKRKK